MACNSMGNFENVFVNEINLLIGIWITDPYIINFIYYIIVEIKKLS